MARTLYYCDHYEIPLPPGHKFPMRKYRLLRERLQTDGRFHFEQAPLADAAVIERAHDSGYVRAFLEGSISPRAMRRIGFPWSEALVKRTLGSVGGTIAATSQAFATGWGGNLAGGTHHAFRCDGAGFCVFNDLAVAILDSRARGVRRAAVVDLDVHQGDGTALIFDSDPDVLTLSMHGRNNFPFRKQRSKIDVELDDGTGDEVYLARLAEVLPEVFRFRPGVIYYQSGVDALETDVLGRLSLSMEGLNRRDRMVMKAARAAAIPFVITLGGGYSDPVELTAEAHANTFRTAAGVFATT